MAVKRYVYKKNDFILIFRSGKSKNAKISDGKKNIVQTYSFSIDQYNFARNNKVSRKFFDLDMAVCFTCPFRGNGGKCYTHKFGQLMGFFGLLRSLPSLDQIKTLPDSIPNDLLNECKGKYIRFGTYGEPSLIPLNWLESLTAICKNYTGYTHRWETLPMEYSNYFMASVETKSQAFFSMALGYRCFFVTDQKDSSFIHCPASKESGKNSYCEKCGLCSGTKGKGKKSVLIFQH